MYKIFMTLKLTLSDILMVKMSKKLSRQKINKWNKGSNKSAPGLEYLIIQKGAKGETA